MAKRLARLPSNMKSALSSLPMTTIRRSVFQRDSDLKTTIPFDYLIPIYVDEILPGDTFSMKLIHVARMAPMVAPIMDNICLTTHWFYVPNRLLWKNWETFITGSSEPEMWYSNPLYTEIDKNGTQQRLYVPQHRSPKSKANDGTVGYQPGSIYDYFGLPTKVPNFHHSALPLRAYELIYQEYFRDENVERSGYYEEYKDQNGKVYETPLTDDDLEPVLSNSDTPQKPWKAGDNKPYFLRRRNKRYDYFTSSLPLPQKGQEVSLIPETGGLPKTRIPVHGFSLFASGYDGKAGFSPPQVNSSYLDLDLGKSGVDVYSITQGPAYYATQQSLPAANQDVWNGPGYYGNVVIGANNETEFQRLPTLAGTKPALVHYDGPVQSDGVTIDTLGPENWPIYVDASEATRALKPELALTVANLRKAFVLQQWMEKSARYGTRYVEAMQGHFGVHCGDYRVQRPEYIGGSKTYININPVAQTSETSSKGPLGTLGANPTAQDQKHLFTKSFVEHGLILGLMCVTADLTYQQGLDRSPWLREDRFDFYWPSFAHIGDQEVQNQEIYTQDDSILVPAAEGGGSVNTAAFGYQERYAEYRYKPSKITGRFRSNATGTDVNGNPIVNLSHWHLSQVFASLPKLNREFIMCNTPIQRVMADTAQLDVLVNCYFSCKAVRPMPVYSIPGLKRL